MNKKKFRKEEILGPGRLGARLSAVVLMTMAGTTSKESRSRLAGAHGGERNWPLGFAVFSRPKATFVQGEVTTDTIVGGDTSCVSFIY